MYVNAKQKENLNLNVAWNNNPNGFREDDFHWSYFCPQNLWKRQKFKYFQNYDYTWFTLVQKKHTHTHMRIHTFARIILSNLLIWLI